MGIEVGIKLVGARVGDFVGAAVGLHDIVSSIGKHIVSPGEQVPVPSEQASHSDRVGASLKVSMGQSAQPKYSSDWSCTPNPSLHITTPLCSKIKNGVPVMLSTDFFAYAVKDASMFFMSKLSGVKLTVPLEPIYIFLRLLVFKNAPEAICVRVLGSTISVKDAHPKNE